VARILPAQHSLAAIGAFSGNRVSGAGHRYRSKPPTFVRRMGNRQQWHRPKHRYPESENSASADSRVRWLNHHWSVRRLDTPERFRRTRTKTWNGSDRYNDTQALLCRVYASSKWRDTRPRKRSEVGSRRERALQSGPFSEAEFCKHAESQRRARCDDRRR